MPEMVWRYCEALGHPELAGHEVEVDYFPLIPMPVYPLSAGDSDASGTCGWLWKFLYLKNVCLGTNVNRCDMLSTSMLPKKKRLGPFLICCDRHGNPSRGADTDHVVSGEDFIIEQFVLLLYPNSFVKKQTIISLCE